MTNSVVASAGMEIVKVINLNEPVGPNTLNTICNDTIAILSTSGTLSVYGLHADRTLHQTHQLPKGATAIASLPGVIYVGYVSGSVYKYDIKSNTSELMYEFRKAITSIIPSQQSGNVFVSTRHPDTSVYSLRGNNVNIVFSVGESGGDDRGVRFRKINAMHTLDNWVYVATDRGLYRFSDVNAPDKYDVSKVISNIDIIDLVAYKTNDGYQCAVLSGDNVLRIIDCVNKDIKTTVKFDKIALSLQRFRGDGNGYLILLGGITKDPRDIVYYKIGNDSNHSEHPVTVARLNNVYFIKTLTSIDSSIYAVTGAGEVIAFVKKEK